MNKILAAITADYTREELENIRDKVCTKSIHDLHMGIDWSREDSCGGSPTEPDLMFLFLLARKLNARRVFEVGTWIGTSASVIAQTGACDVATCDARNKYRGLNPRVTFIHGHSTGVLADVDRIKKLKPLHFCFIDAKLSEDDAEKIVGLFAGGYVAVAVHDIDMRNGANNMNLLQRQAPGLLAFLPNLDMPYISNGVQINACTGLVISGGLI